MFGKVTKVSAANVAMQLSNTAVVVGNTAADGTFTAQ